METIAIGQAIMAVVTLKKNRDTVGGGVPIFYAKDEEERTKTATYISKIVQGMVHDLENGTYIIVKHG